MTFVCCRKREFFWICVVFCVASFVQQQKHKIKMQTFKFTLTNWNGLQLFFPTLALCQLVVHLSHSIHHRIHSMPEQRKKNSKVSQEHVALCLVFIYYFSNCMGNCEQQKHINLHKSTTFLPSLWWQLLLLLLLLLTLFFFFFSIYFCKATVSIRFFIQMGFSRLKAFLHITRTLNRVPE